MQIFTSFSSLFATHGRSPCDLCTEIDIGVIIGCRFVSDNVSLAFTPRSGIITTMLCRGFGGAD
jgi:hypothetical protein